jgi:cobalt-zinc-cadmium efflux system outer membrane protein
MKKRIYLVIIQFFFLQILKAQVDVPFQYINLNFKEYIYLVKSNNLEYAAEKLNMNISDAAIEAAKVFQDPYFSLGLSEDLEENSRTGYGFSTEFGKTIDLVGERKARIDLTRSEKELTNALLADYLRNLQAEATLAYLEAMKQKQLFIVRTDSYQTMKKLSEADSIRLKLGSIMEIDAIQSRLEAGILLNELTHSLAEWKNSLALISLQAGVANSDTVYLPSGLPDNTFRDFTLPGLISEAMNNRSDLQAALQNKDVSQKALKLARKSRNTDVDLIVGYSDYYQGAGFSSRSTGLSAGIAIPLKFSNIYGGDLKAAEIRVQQADIIFKQAELQITTEIIQAWELYQAYSKEVQNFNKGLLEGAGNVRKGKIYSYQRGETSLLEVLNAQRTFNEIQTNYYETLFNQASALIELEKAAGIWDIDFIHIENP